MKEFDLKESKKKGVKLCTRDGHLATIVSYRNPNNKEKGFYFKKMPIVGMIRHLVKSNEEYHYYWIAENYFIDGSRIMVPQYESDLMIVTDESDIMSFEQEKVIVDNKEIGD